MKDFSKPQDVTDLDVAFGGSIDRLLPDWKDIPDEFKDGITKWERIAGRWFGVGLPNGTEFKPKEGIDSKKAIRHARTILGSFAPKHEHKEAGVAYLLSLWFDNIVIPEDNQQ